MNAREFCEQVNAMGLGEYSLTAFDGDSEQAEEVTGFIHDKETLTIELQTDEQ